MIMLRALQLGLRLSDLEEITIGDLIYMIIENDNDNYEKPIKDTQDDFRSF